MLPTSVGDSARGFVNVSDARTENALVFDTKANALAKAIGGRIDEPRVLERNVVIIDIRLEVHVHL